MQLVAPKFHEMEVKIVASRGADKGLLEYAKKVTDEYCGVINQIMDRFIVEYGAKLDEEATDNERELKFLKIKSEEYENATRMLRLINFYSKGTNV